jgi:hypothetical protein
MDVYSPALSDYYERKCRERRLLRMEPEDVVHGFLANRLSRRKWLEDWQRILAKSGVRSTDTSLRRWIRNAFCYYLRELLSEQNRERARRDSCAEVEPVTFDEHDAAFDAQLVRQAVRVALEKTRESCASAGQQAHFEILMARLTGEPFERIAGRLGLTMRQAMDRRRTAEARFREQFFAVVSESFLPNSAHRNRDTIRAEILELLEGFQG